ncbi:hypothetical protein [Vagococcus fluvialis]|uniref:hypothetical protein n=1 Tax=Vagococcus fluvialis TaxID=2738 RepID=UPI0037AB57AC
MREKDKLEFFLQNKLNAKGKFIVIVILFFLWLKFSTNLFFMLKFFGVSIIIAVLLTIYELFFYKKIYKE